VVLDEGGQSKYSTDARSPVVGVVAPYRRKHHPATDAHTRPLITMADRALSCIGLLAARVVGLFGRLVEPREATPIQLAGWIHGHTTGQPLVVGGERDHVITAVGRRLAVHGVGEAAGDALFQIVDVIVLRSVVRP